MAILVLGGAGYIGSHMVDRLIEKGEEEVVVVDSLVTGHRAAVHPAAKFYQGDLADREFMSMVFREILMWMPLFTLQLILWLQSP